MISPIKKFLIFWDKLGRVGAFALGAFTIISVAGISFIFAFLFKTPEIIALVGLVPLLSLYIICGYFPTVTRAYKEQGFKSLIFGPKLEIQAQKLIFFTTGYISILALIVSLNT